MAAEYVLFEDRRESDGVLDDAHNVLESSEDLSGREVLTRLRALDWNHPCLLVHRAEGEDRWSQVLLGLNTPEGLGEDA